MASIVALSLIGGLAEAVLLVLVVRVGLYAAGQLDDLGQVPLLAWSLSTPFALSVAAALGLTNLAVHYLVARSSAALQAEIAATLRIRVVRAFVAATWARQAVERDGTVNELVAVFVPAMASLVASMTRGAAGGLHTIALLAVAIVVDPVATILVIVAGVGVFVLLRPVSAWTRRRADVSVSATSDFNAAIARLTGMTMELRSFGVEEAATTELEAQALEIARRDRLTRTAGGFGETVFRDLALLFLVGAVAVLSVVSTTEVAGIGAVVLLVVRAAGSAQSLQELRQTASQLGPQVARLGTALDSLEVDRRHLGRTALADVSTLRFEQVGFRYDRSDVLVDVDLELRDGEVVGLVGASGAGKSTLAQLVLGLRVPTSGRITADGVDLVDIVPSDWARLVAFVPQEPQLIEGTVAHNIAFYRDDIEQGVIAEAARAANIAAEIEELPHGYETTLGARGGGLSGGQKQRVAIARALVGGPRIVVLDEPTSALDPISEHAVRETIRSLRGSVGFLVIAHRPGVLEICDRVIELRDGRLHETIA